MICSVGFIGLGKKLSPKVTEHKKNHSFDLSKGNSIHSLVLRNLNDDIVTDREFQIINSELEQYFKLKEEARAELKVKTSPGPDIKKLKQEPCAQVVDEFQKSWLPN